MASDERHSICLEDKILSPLYSFTVAKGQLCDGCQAADIAPDIKKWYRSNVCMRLKLVSGYSASV